MKVQITANTNGKGKETDEARDMLITKIDFGYQSTSFFPEDPFKGELRAHFDPSGYGNGAWHVEAYGLVLGDRQWLKEFKAGLRAIGFSIKAVQNVKYSEKDRQTDSHVVLDVGPVFYASWNRLVKQGKLQS